MKPPPLEVADIIRARGRNFLEHSPGWFTWQHLKVFRAITCCRSAALGGHLDQCSECGYRAISFCSCRNRHCPKCQTNARNKWLAARSQELLSTGYFHLVFTLPHQLCGLALQNKTILYDLLLRASAETLWEVAADPKHLGAEIGFLSVLHTWGQNLQAHPHVHCVIPAGGLSPDHSRWVHSQQRFFLPRKVLSRVFRGKFVAGLKRAFRQGKLVLHGRLRHLANPDNRAPYVFARDRLRSYPAAIRELQHEGHLHRNCRHRTRRHANNRIESDHRHVKRRLRAMQGPRTTATACALIAGIEAVQMIRKGQVLGITKKNLHGQDWVFGSLLGLN